MSSDEEDSSDLSQTPAPAPVQTDQPVQSEQAVSQEDQGKKNLYIAQTTIIK